MRLYIISNRKADTLVKKRFELYLKKIGIVLKLPPDLNYSTYASKEYKNARIVKGLSEGADGDSAS